MTGARDKIRVALARRRYLGEPGTRYLLAALRRHDMDFGLAALSC